MNWDPIGINEELAKNNWKGSDFYAHWKNKEWKFKFKSQADYIEEYIYVLIMCNLRQYFHSQSSNYQLQRDIEFCIGQIQLLFLRSNRYPKKKRNQVERQAKGSNVVEKSQLIQQKTQSYPPHQDNKMVKEFTIQDEAEKQSQSKSQGWFESLLKVIPFGTNFAKSTLGMRQYNEDEEGERLMKRPLD